MDSRLKVGKGRTSSARSPSRRGVISTNKAAPPLYLQVANVLKDEIVSGVHAVGSQLPTEDRLCKRFSVSRYTVREALRLLREDDLVSSRKGAGTVVTPPRPMGQDIHQVMSINDLLAFGTDTRLVIESINTVIIDAGLAARTGLPRGEEWLQVCGYRQAQDNEAPLCWTEYYINRAFAAVGRLLQRHSGPIFPLIEDMYGLNITEVQQQISASLVSSALATALQVRLDSAALEVRRAYRTNDDRIAQVTINTHPAARFQHSMTMHRVKGQA